MRFFAVAGPGTEGALVAELRDLGFRGLRKRRRGVDFHGGWEEGWRACLHSRIAQRVQAELGRFAAADQESLYAGVQSVDWSPFVDPGRTLSVSAFCHSSVLTHSGFVALKAKDAIVDQVRERCGARPNVSKDAADFSLFVHLLRNQGTVYADLAGEPLFKRGYRLEGGAAPLKETLAAALLRLSEWDRQTAFLDPMCGSGTIPIEAALWARGVAPGLERSFGFERWVMHDDKAAEAMRRLRGDARREARGQSPKIAGSDADPAAVDIARSNARRAGLRMNFRTQRLQDFQADGPRRVVVTNPPYDERLAADEKLCREWGAAFSRLHGWKVCVLTANPELAHAIPIRATQQIEIHNGPIDCRFCIYEVP